MAALRPGSTVFDAVEREKEYIAWVKQDNDRITAETGKRPLVYSETFGCQQNEADSEKLLGLSVMMGFLVTDKKEEADLIVVNTCAVREHAEKRALSCIG